MFAKVVFILITLGACGCALLALRQDRMQVASELTQAQLRIHAEDEQLWALRADVARSVTPTNVEALASTLGELRPIVDIPIPGRTPAASPLLPIIARVNPEPATRGRSPGIKPGVAQAKPGPNPVGPGVRGVGAQDARPAPGRPAPRRTTRERSSAQPIRVARSEAAR